MALRLNNTQGQSLPLIVSTLAVVLAAGMISVGAVQKPQQRAAPKAISPSPSKPTEEKGQVAVEGALSTDDSTVGDPVRFWINVSNQTTDVICPVNVSFPTLAGYKDPTFVEPAPSSGGVAGCLKPGQRTTVRGVLTAHQAHDAQNVEALVSWKESNGASSQIVVNLGQNKIKSSYAWLGHLYEGAKDFALPVMLAVMTFFFGRWDKKKEQIRKEAEDIREHERKDAEDARERERKKAEDDREQARKEAADERERARKEAETLRTWQAETWNKMLPTSHALNENHYLQIAASLWASTDDVKECLTDPSAPDLMDRERRAFYSLMLLGSRIKRLNDSKSGFFFTDRVAELLAMRCLDDYVQEFYTPSLNHDLYQDVIELCSPDKKNKKSFIEKCKNPPQLAASENAIWECWQFFQSRYSTEEGKRAIFLLTGFRAILDYEMNRPYEHWYKNPEKLVLRKDAKSGIDVEETLRVAARRIAEEEGPDSNFVQLTEEYLASGKKEGKRSPL